MVRSGQFVRGTGSRSMKRSFSIAEVVRRFAHRPRVYAAIALPLAIPFVLAAVTTDGALTQIPSVNGAQ